MRVILASLVLAFATGCSHSVTNPNAYFSFAAATGVNSDTDVAAQKRTLKIHSIKLSGIADQQAIVQIQPDNQVSVAQHHFWAEHPNDMLSKKLHNLLSNKLDLWQVVSANVPTSGYNTIYLMVEVTEFAGHYEAGTLLSGSWYLYEKNNTSDQLLAYQNFTLSEPLTKDGFPALVRALETSWMQVAKQIAKQLHALEN
ncbi:hypothetical protein PA25_33930 [Pseudoalteromonas sp. A25]|uniref:PqiC family protein n=1 Tax=Pseudoalteromonas sp. A25 TaxID=116092 RepID=UPI001260C810|nr:ABC-type transport auxiliary lipoprotein family protein [Pseudoalteromonas sp. A25]BBN83408.1 hypothetical protein PA25_33930 [Pseudoalteromonas sp. A25]